jgi:hypothetical protein
LEYLLRPAPFDSRMLPDWLARLRADRAVAAIDVRVLPADELEAPREATEDELLSVGVMLDRQVLDAWLGALPHLVRVAEGPTVRRADMSVEMSAEWYVDVRRPDRLWLAPSREFPTMLWIPAGTGVEGMVAALDGLIPLGDWSHTQLPAIARWYAGHLSQLMVASVHTGDLVQATGPELDRYFARNPFVRFGWWGSEYLDNPHLDESVAAVVNIRLQREYGKQRRGRVPSMTWQTVHSGSFISFEAHPGGPVVINLRYRPTRHVEVVERINTEFGSRYPTDLPVDVIAALIGFGFCTVEQAEGDADPDAAADAVAADVTVLAALYHGDLGAVGRLRRYLSHPSIEVRRSLGQAALDYNYLFMLEEMRLVERDREFGAIIDRALNGNGNRPSSVDPFDNFGFSDEPDAWLDRDQSGAHVG